MDFFTFRSHEKLQRAASENIDEILQDVSTLFGDSKAVEEVSSPAPILMSLPGEILSLIAEASVESYYIQIDENARISFVPPIRRIEIVSPDFANGIKRGMLSRFKGYLVFPDIYNEHVPEILGRSGLAWIVPRVTSVTVMIEKHRSTSRRLPNIKNPYDIYQELGDINIVCWMPHLEGTWLSFECICFDIVIVTEIESPEIDRAQLDDVRDTRVGPCCSELRQIATAIGIDTWTNLAFIMRFVGPWRLRSGTVYQHLEWKFDGSESRGLIIYITERLDLAVRHYTGDEDHSIIYD